MSHSLIRRIIHRSLVLANFQENHTTKKLGFESLFAGFSLMKNLGWIWLKSLRRNQLTARKAGSLSFVIVRSRWSVNWKNRGTLEDQPITTGVEGERREGPTKLQRRRLSSLGVGRKISWVSSKTATCTLTHYGSTTTTTVSGTPTKGVTTVHYAFWNRTPPLFFSNSRNPLNANRRELKS